MTLTPIDTFQSSIGTWFAKREDMACISTKLYPSGSKVRQYLAMAQQQPNQPMLVGCSANSCMQVYVAAAAHQTNVKGIIYVPARAKISEATQYCIDLGAEVNEVRPGYPSVYRKKTKERGQQLGSYVHWNPNQAVLDTMEQCGNLPLEVKRIVIPSGSGLTAAGILAGLTKIEYGLNVEVAVVCFSTLADPSRIIALAKKAADTIVLPSLQIIRLKNYDKPSVAALPDGTPLDPFYAAKALPYLQEGDCLWITGLRPVCAMPKECKNRFATWWWPKEKINYFGKNSEKVGIDT